MKYIRTLTFMLMTNSIMASDFIVPEENLLPKFSPQQIKDIRYLAEFFGFSAEDIIAPPPHQRKMSQEDYVLGLFPGPEHKKKRKEALEFIRTYLG